MILPIYIYGQPVLRKIGLDIDVSVRCSGVYSYKIIDPLLFYTNVCGKVEQEYSREELDGQLKTEFQRFLSAQSSSILFCAWR